MASKNTNDYEAMKMDHEEATRIQACTRYLSGGLSDSESEAFEEHFFSCLQCAEELKAGTTFAEDVRAVFHEQAQRLVVGSPPVSPQTGPGWLEKLRTAFALPLAAAAVALIAVVMYQNLVTDRHLRAQVAELSAPQSLAWVPLKIARGAELTSIQKRQPFWMAYFNLPPTAQFPVYCDIESPLGTKLKTVRLAAPALGQPSSLLLRSADFPAGNYKFKIRNQNSDSVIAVYTLDISPE